MRVALFALALAAPARADIIALPPAPPGPEVPCSAASACTNLERYVECSASACPEASDPTLVARELCRQDGVVRLCVKPADETRRPGLFCGHVDRVSSLGLALISLAAASRRRTR